MSLDSDLLHMRHALALGRRGLGNTWPNPAVGCVIVAENRIVGRGWTQPGGRPHAEAIALAQAGPLAQGATAYVTLEPCAHHGHTPACAAALIQAGIAHVVSAATDPDPRVSGQGHAMLRAAGIIVTEGVAGPEARRANAGFFSRIEQNRPQITLKLATSLDGRIATASGQSRWITGPEARRAVHALRGQHDAVMVGIGTALADDPDLTIRDLGYVRQPVRVVVDSGLRLPLTSRLVQRAREVPLWLCHADGAQGGALQAAGARLIPCPRSGAGLKIGDLLGHLATAGLTRLLCEGGAGIAAALLAAGLVDELVLFTAGRLFGAAGTAAVANLGEVALGTPPAFQLIDQRPVGADLMQHWRRVP